MSMLGLRDLVLIAPTPSSLHHQHQPISSENHHNSSLPSSASLSVGFGIFPLLTATPCLPHPHPNHNNDLQNQEYGASNNNNYWNLKMCPEVNNHNPPKRGVINVDDDDEESHKLVMVESDQENGVFGNDFRACQDCGNRAKKDCVYRRCRTCCKGRGYDCSTHVKSTWVPSVRRREREMAVVAGSGGGGVKRTRALVGGSLQNAPATSHSSNSNNATTPKTSSQQDGDLKQSLPDHIRAPAVFRCHRVSAISNGEDEFAYLATVHISGHVFKGFLYDHGLHDKNNNAMIMPNSVSELQLGNNNCSNGKNFNRDSSFSAAIAHGVPTNDAYPAAT